MKSIYLILAICLSFIVDKSLSNSPQLNQKLEACPEITNVSFQVYSDKYISVDTRYNICQSVENYDKDGIIFKMKKCLSSKCNYKAYVNPCAVTCHINLINSIQESSGSETSECRNDCDFLKTTQFIRYEKRINDTNQRCGDKHFCDLNGCCVEREMSTITTSSENQTFGTNISTTHMTSKSAIPISTNPIVKTTQVTNQMVTTISTSTLMTTQITSAADKCRVIDKCVTIDQKSIKCRKYRDLLCFSAKIERKEFFCTATDCLWKCKGWQFAVDRKSKICSKCVYIECQSDSAPVQSVASHSRTTSSNTMKTNFVI